MNFNNLIVTVIGARGLSLKGHSELDAFVNLTLSRKGNWKSKVQTDVVRTAADCNWNQQCEFSVNDLDLVLNITANHRTTLGTADCIGALELPLRSLVSIRTPTWYRLCKKGKYSIAEQLKKYRGEVCLKFEFSNKVHSETTQNLSDPSFSVTSSRGWLLFSVVTLAFIYIMFYELN
ncbi:unnamed protein product [Thelazia callipaeda]|uniref:C2 domain-containing protein n=1 Tax=Thelazia callipaeda TaxID=103827 RepID=A0A0N5D8Q8_THECL|nr:unnamed protein product [Thelazia callipaeda]